MEKEPIGMSGLTTAQLIAGQEQEILDAWVAAQLTSITRRADLISAADMRRESAEFLRDFVQAISTENWEDITAPPFKPLLQRLGDLAPGQSRDSPRPKRPPTCSASKILSWFFCRKNWAISRRFSTARWYASRSCWTNWGCTPLRHTARAEE